MAKIKLRRATIEDLDLVCLLENKLFLDSYSRVQIESDLSNTDQIFLFVAYFGDEIVGYVYFSIIFDEAELFRIAVLEQYRGFGYGEAILKESIEKLKMNVKKIFLEVSVDNTIAINLYQKLKFKNINRRKQYYFDGSDAFVMELVV